jgi:hypothetical protein
MGLLFDEIVRPLRAEHQFMVAAALYGWLAEDDAEEAEIRFLAVEDLWLLLDPEQRSALLCDALAGLWAVVPRTHQKYEQLGRLPE